MIFPRSAAVRVGVTDFPADGLAYRPPQAMQVTTR